MKSVNPPPFATRLLHWFYASPQAEELEGDLDELFQQRVREVGLKQARWRYVRDVVSLLRPSLMKRKEKRYSKPTHTTMLRNYLTIAWRNLRKNTAYSFINIGGLAVGMTVAMLIGLWIYDEVSFNQYHPNYDRIAQVMQHGTFNGKVDSQVANPGVLGPEIRAKYGPTFKYVVQASWPGSYILSLGDNHVSKEGIYFEPDGPVMLGLRMRQGTYSGLKDPYSIMLSESVAKSLFGTQNPLGKTLKVGRKYAVKVTGVYEDLPYNTSFRNVKVIMPWALWLIDNPWAKTMRNPWGSNFSQTFAQVADHITMEEASGRIKNVKLANVSKEEARYNWVVFLHPMRKWELYSEFKNGVNTGGQIKYVWLFGIIGIFVLVLACINFMNLATARSEKRAKEVGIRKAVGSVRSQLINQFFAESYLVVSLAFLVAVLLVLVLLPPFNEIADKKIEFLWAHPQFWLMSLAFIGMTGLLAGSYPAFYLSSFQPLSVLKGTFRVGKWAAIPRKALVVLQFTVSIVLIIGTIIVYQQIQHAKNRPIGYNRNGLVTMGVEKEISDHFDAFRAELKSAGAIEELAVSNSPLTGVWNTNGGFDWAGKDPNLAVDFPNANVTYEWGKTVGWKVKQGRDFSREFATDSSAFIINEAMKQFLGFKNPVGKILKWDNKPYTIIGVVSDIMAESPFYPVRPSLYHITGSDYQGNMVLRLHAAKSPNQSIALIEQIWRKYVPNVPFQYEFVHQQYGAKFKSEERIGTLSAYFAVLAIFISCLGIFGMASFVAEQRTKEIGIRKVLGASVINLWQLLTKDFAVLVLVACVIASPIAWYYLTDWLREYDYRVTISWWVFVVAAAGALLITLITVSFQSIKAALVNPVKSLRSE
ncbi:ABC-type antimicrobial peptide transport system permease subunit [Larkinella arboricola]|uniref:ABC-type antimicrobial peptide transport system permease subunit n=1 Tax=Larkinella arboricola TaxID=643671 RepID=A0A327WIM6_LARAB|nr:ABC transporter permease [Larkinella arboricola]RAJ90834.1 ABC-type antimicrobial peptide transport system permease subunit [Larkinella arboricola]